MTKLSLHNVCLDYPIYGAYDFSIKRRLLGRMIRETPETRTVRAIDDISIEASAGARIGIAGPNGSGKSTLLRLIAGIYPPTSGRVSIAGSVMPLLGLSSGTNSDLAAIDNINLLLRIGGRKPTAAVVDDIWNFTELEDRARQLPLRTFSSGMLMRVLFATATAFPADILLLDEWLSVVDENFSAKAEARLLKLVSQAAIVMIASHDRGLLRRTCNSIINFDRGRIVNTIPVETNPGPHLELVEKRA
jgi:lipopolysaccharide transport system ATP-binding protein